MAKTEKLNARFVASAGVGKHGDGGGLWLRVRENGSRAWVFRYTRHGRPREMGLGPLDTVSLAEARIEARDARRLVRRGKDPISVRRAQQSGEVPTFREAATKYIDTHERAWRNTKHRQQWRATIDAYANPIIGELPVDEINVGEVMRVLDPIWRSKRETARRLQGRIERVLDWARVQGYRSGNNPARWKGNLQAILPGRSKFDIKHHRALEWKGVPAFMKELRQREGMSARALEFLVLTATRSGETRAATWSEVDLESRIWTVPASRMKAGKEHRVPLSNQAVGLLVQMPRIEGTDFVFPSPRKAGPLSDMAMTKLMRDMKVDAVPHGFRSSFRDWAAESTAYPYAVAEMALAHSISNEVEAAYRRGDLLAKRTRLMQEWADFCDLGVTKKTAEVVAIRSS